MKLTIQKICSYIGGISLVALGVNLSKMAGLGISPVASLPHAVELIWGIELGLATAIVYLFLIAFQLLLLRKFSIFPFFQLLTTLIMSGFTTMTSSAHLLKWLEPPANYMQSLVLLAISIVLIGIGVFFYIRPGYIPIPSEGTAKTLVKVSHGKLQFPNAKVAVDCGMVVISAILTLVALGGMAGIREGTVITALLVGKMVGVCRKIEKSVVSRKKHITEVGEL